MADQYGHDHILLLAANLEHLFLCILRWGKDQPLGYLGLVVTGVERQRDQVRCAQVCADDILTDQAGELGQQGDDLWSRPPCA